jgi:hypothetical protein
MIPHMSRFLPPVNPVASGEGHVRQAGIVAEASRKQQS